MLKNLQRISLIVLIVILVSGMGSFASPLRAAGPVINEFVANHTGTDTDEFIEVLGDPSTDYSNLSILVLEGDSTGNGVVDRVYAVGTTDADGLWWTGLQPNAIENGTLTILLVDTFTGSQGQDLDTDNDGVLDITPWTSILDAVGVHDGGSLDTVYASVVLVSGFDGVALLPGGASRIPNGTDTDTINDWMRNDFDMEGLPSDTNPADTWDNSEALNTPDAANQAKGPNAVTFSGLGATSPFAALAVALVASGGLVVLRKRK